MAKHKGQKQAPPLSRSEIMARIPSQNTSPELAVRSYLWARGIRFKLHQVVDGVRPDLVWKNRKIVVFIDGCFWHGCSLHCRRPSTRRDYWNPKIDGNIQRDLVVTEALRAAGWRVLRYWEHDVINNLGCVGDGIIAALARK